MTERQLTGDRLRMVARYLDSFDKMTREIYGAIVDGPEAPDGWQVEVVVSPNVTREEAKIIFEEASGRDVQDDLLRWADELDAAAVRDAFDRMVITAKPDDSWSIEVVAENVDGVPVIRSIKNAHIEGEGLGVPYANSGASVKDPLVPPLRWLARLFGR